MIAVTLVDYPFTHSYAPGYWNWGTGYMRGRIGDIDISDIHDRGDCMDSWVLMDKWTEQLTST